jgi:hypothetical protein
MSLFPLPLAPFEHYMLADDRPDYPMTPFVRLEFQGRFDREGFPRAVARALAAHPLLRARVVGSPRATTAELRWVDASDQFPFLSWAPAGEPIEFPAGRQIDLHREIGLRLWVREGEQHTELLVQAHHACCDGIGLFTFLERLLAEYAAQNAAEPGPLDSPPDPDLIRRRGYGRLGWREQARALYQDLFRVARYYRRQPMPLALGRTAPQPNGPGDFPALVSHTFGPRETRRILRAAKARQVSVNAFVLRDILLGLDAWNRTQTPFEPVGRNLRVAIPVNLREPEAGPMPAVNAVSMAFVDREPSELADRTALVQSLHREMEETKKLRRGLSLLPALRLLGAFRGGIASQVRRERCLGTSVFSNLGVLFARSPLLDGHGRVVAGNMLLEGVSVVPPVRPLTHATFALTTYAQRLTLGMCYAGACLQRPQAEELLGLCVQSLQASLPARSNEPVAIAG